MEARNPPTDVLIMRKFGAGCEMRWDRVAWGHKCARSRTEIASGWCTATVIDDQDHLAGDAPKIPASFDKVWSGQIQVDRPPPFNFRKKKALYSKLCFFHKTNLTLSREKEKRLLKIPPGAKTTASQVKRTCWSPGVPPASHRRPQAAAAAMTEQLSESLPASCWQISSPLQLHLH